MHKNLSLDRIFGPDPVPEFRYCTRCGVQQVNAKRVSPECLDCERLPRYSPRGTQGKYLPPYNPDFDISVHYDKVPNGCPTLATLEALDLTYVLYVSSRGDSFEVDWAEGLTNPESEPDWPIVVLSTHGKVLDWWAGFDLAQLNTIPAQRDAITHTHDTEAAQHGVPTEQEQAA